MTLQPMVRDRADAKIGGVCAALARSAGLDPLLVRIGFALLAVLTGGAVVLGYLALWGLTPLRNTGQVPLRSLLPFTRTWSPTALVAVVIVSCLVLGAMVTGSGPGTLIVMLLVLVLLRNGSTRTQAPPAPRPAPTTPFERLARAWETRLENVDAGRPVDWVPEFSDPDPYRIFSPTEVVGSSVHRRNGRRSWFGVLLGVGALWFGFGLAGFLGFPVPPLAWVSATLAVLALALVWSAQPSRAARGRPPFLATVTVLTGLLAAGMLTTHLTLGSIPVERLTIADSTPTVVTAGAVDLGVGDHRLDFSGVAVTDTSEVTYDMLAGEAIVVPPATGNVVINTTVDVGEVTSPAAYHEGLKLAETWRRTDDPGAPTLTINLKVGVGEVRVVEP